MTQDAGQLFNELIDEYGKRVKGSKDGRGDIPKPPGLGAFWLNSETGILYMASLDEDGETIWQSVDDVMGPGDGPDLLWV